MRAMRDAVDEVIDVAKQEGIDADIEKDGLLHVARNQAQLQRLHAGLRHEQDWGADPLDFVELTAPRWTSGSASPARSGASSVRTAPASSPPS